MRAGPIMDVLRGVIDGQIGNAVDFAQLRAMPVRLPAAFVVPDGDQAAASNRASGAHDQRVVQSFAVYLCLNMQQRVGAAPGQSDDVWVQCQKIVNALAGWTHPDASGLTDYAGSIPATVDAGGLVYKLMFKCPYHIRKVK